MVEPTPITDAGLLEIERLEKAATPGPWKAKPMGGDSYVTAPTHRWYKALAQNYGHPIAVPRCFPDHPGGGFTDDAAGFAHDDAYFIAAARNALPSLVHRLRTSEARVKELEAALARTASIGSHWHDRAATAELCAQNDVAEAEARAEKAETEVARLQVVLDDLIAAIESRTEHTATARSSCGKPKCLACAALAQADAELNISRAASRADPAPPVQSSAQPAADETMRVLVEAAIPLEVLAGQIRQRPYAEMSADFQAKILNTVDLIRAHVAGSPSGKGE